MGSLLEIVQLVHDVLLCNNSLPVFLSGEHTLCPRRSKQLLRVPSLSYVNSNRQQSVERTDLQLGFHRSKTTSRCILAMNSLYHVKEVKPEQQLAK